MHESILPVLQWLLDVAYDVLFNVQQDTTRETIINLLASNFDSC